MRLRSLCFFLFLIGVLLNACSKGDEIQERVVQNRNPSEKPEAIAVPIENTMGVTFHTPRVYEGYTMFTIYKDTYLINNCGQVINHWPSEYEPGNAVYLLEDGSILRAGKIENQDMPYGGAGGIVERIDWQGQILWSFKYSDTGFTQHHDIYPMPNGNVLFLVASKKSEGEAVQAGRNPMKIADGVLYNEQLVEIRPEGTHNGTVVWEWNIWDHLVQEFDSTKSNFGSIKENPQLLDINYLGENKNNSDADWLHINSVQYNETLDQLLLSVHGLDEIYIIDHSTTSKEASSNKGGLRGKGGDILYRWGNPQAYLRGPATDRKLFKQHFPHWIPTPYPDGGKIIIYNNGSGRPKDFSSVDIINPPMDGTGNYMLTPGETYGPPEPEWSYIDPKDPTHFYSRLLSSAQRLPNGNTLICEGLNGHIFEIDAQRNLVWQYVNPETTQGMILIQGDMPESNRLFRAIKYPKEYPAFRGKHIELGNPIEKQFDIGNCQ